MCTGLAFSLGLDQQNDVLDASIANVQFSQNSVHEKDTLEDLKERLAWKLNDLQQQMNDSRVGDESDPQQQQQQLEQRKPGIIDDCEIYA